MMPGSGHQTERRNRNPDPEFHFTLIQSVAVTTPRQLLQPFVMVYTPVKQAEDVFLLGTSA